MPSNPCDHPPFKLHQQLKFLRVHLTNSDLDCKTLNSFKQLVNLDIKLAFLFSKPKTLILPKLRVFGVRDHQNKSYVLKIPRLAVPFCDEI